MKFTKMNGLGNDYIFVDTLSERICNPCETAVRLSDRHRGIGGDGLVLIGRADNADFSMRIFNSDGSEGEMCGNALRCVGKYVYDNGLTDKLELTVATKAGIRELTLKKSNGKVECASANIGKAVAGHKQDGRFECNLVVRGTEYRCYCVSVGNPHCVIFVDDFFDGIMEVGREISENTEAFPERTNVEFVLRDASNGCLTMRVYERGSGETLACGTGAAASFYASYRLNAVGREAVVRLPGGDLHCRLNDRDEIIITGRAELNFVGEI